MSDISDTVETIEVKKHRTYQENLDVAARSLAKLTGYKGPIEDREKARDFFDHYTLKRVSAHGLTGQGVSINYLEKDAPKKVAEPRYGGGSPVATSTRYEW